MPQQEVRSGENARKPPGAYKHLVCGDHGHSSRTGNACLQALMIVLCKLRRREEYSSPQKGKEKRGTTLGHLLHTRPRDGCCVLELMESWSPSYGEITSAVAGCLCPRPPSPQFLYGRNPNSHSDGIWRWDL